MSTEPGTGDIFGGPLEEAAGTGRKRPRPFDVVQAVFLGIGDTVKDMVHAGQDEARRAHDEAWHRYDELTKHRRKNREAESDD
jgi:hypothetical protein